MADDEATVGGGSAPGRAGRPARSRTVKATAVGSPAAKKAASGRAAAASKAGTARARPATEIGPDAPPRKTRRATSAADPPAAPARKATTKKAAPSRAPAGEAPVSKAAKRAPAAPPGAVLAGGTTNRASAPRGAGQASGRRSRLAAEQTFDDDLVVPQAAAAPEDPHARIRGILRAAAREVEARNAPSTSFSSPPPPPPVADIGRADQPATRVLIAPDPAPPLDAEADEEELEEADPAPAPDEGDWAPPEVLEAETRDMAAPPAPRLTPPRPAVPPEAAAPPIPDALDAVDQPAPPPAPAQAPARRRGAGTSILAIVLAVVIPLLGGIVGFVLANRARRDGKPLAGLARIVSIVAVVLWLVGGGVGLLGLSGSRGVDYSELKVGDCFNSASSNQVRAVKVLPCSKRHDSEIFYLVTHPAKKGDPYPGRDPLVQFAADSCLGQPLTDYLGIPLEQSKLKDFEIVPEAAAWKDGRRVLVCGVDTAGAGRVTGSVKGTRR